jgi:Ca-activated chloride channel family protein
VGNEYFYINLTRLTSGHYFRVLYNYNQTPLEEIFTSAFQSLGGFITSFDLHTTLQDGFCYGRYSLSLNSNSVYLNKPILQVGKYLGDFPFVVEASGIFNSIPFSKTIVVAEEDIIELDSLNEEMWAGNYIQFLEDQSQANDVVSEIIDVSVKERVLSLYSAFLCLEPSRGGEVCYDCMDESGLPSEVEDTADAEIDSIALAAFPNPFNSQVNIRVNVASLGSDNATYRIYNILGEVVKTFQLETDQLNKDYNLIWDGRNDYGATVASGIYFFVASTPQKNYTLKLLLMK